LQSGSDDAAFSNWAKRKISENANHENGKFPNRENGKNENSVNTNSAKSVAATTPATQNQQS